MTIQRSMVPILDQAECCGVACQTVRLNGVWRVEISGNYEQGQTQKVGLIFSNGESYEFGYNYFHENITSNGGSFESDYLFGSFEGYIPGGGLWEATISRFSGNTYSPGPPGMPADGSTYELAVSWCPECANGITCTVSFNDVIWQSYTIEDACLARYDYECEVASVCTPPTVISNDMSTVLDCFVQVTDLGGGLYQIIADDLNASGLWTDPLAFYTGTTSVPWLYSGAGFMCYDCVDADGWLSSPYRLWSVVDPNDGNAPYTIPVEVSDVGFGTIFGIGTGAVGLKAQIDYNFNIPPSQCDGLNVLRTQAQALLDAWVAQFGSGVPVQVRNAIVRAVECYGYRESVIPGETLDVTHVGMQVDDYYISNPIPSNAIDFEIECGRLPESPNIIKWVYNSPM